MTSTQIDGLMPVVIMMGLAVLLFLGGHFASVLLSRKKPTQLKQTAYECGEIPVGSAWSAFNIRFYVVGLIFIIFDVESVLMFPVATIFNEMNAMGEGVYILLVFLSFISVLIEGIAYCWKKGDLDWVKSYQVSARKSTVTQSKKVSV
ncbi:MAG: NADH-quinone oxidoreductase subunit A [Bacteriovoracia bacterium]